MKRIVTSALGIRRAVLAAIVAVCATVATGQSIPWRSSLSSALAEAKQSNKLVMVFLHADYCSWCQNMKSTTFKEAATAKVMESVVPVMLNVEGPGGDVKAKYGVSGIPGFLFIEPDGKAFGKLVGFMTPTLFRDEVRKFSSAFSARPALLAQIKRSPKDGEANARLAWMYGIQRDLDPALKHLAAAERAGYKGSHKAKALNMIGDIYQLSDRLQSAIQKFKAAFESTNDVADQSYALVSLLSCYNALKNKDMAIKYARQLIALPGATPEYVEFAKNHLKKRGLIE